MALHAEEHFLTLQMHELLTYLGQRGVTTLLVNSTSSTQNQGSGPEIDISYLTDTALFFRYYEYRGEIRQAVSVMKR
jgi:circadian clock protein KaiC